MKRAATDDVLSRLLDALRNGPDVGRAFGDPATRANLTATGLTDSAKALLLSFCLQRRPTPSATPPSPDGPLIRPLLLITPGEEQAARFADDLQLLLSLQTLQHATIPRVTLLPMRPITRPSARSTWSAPEQASQRVTALRQLATATTPCVVTTAAALRQAVPSRRRLVSTLIPLRVGATIDRDRFLRRLVDLGYHPATRVDQPGQFAARGGVIDCFDPGDDVPIRLELFGDQIESLRTFDPSAQTSLAHLQEWQLGPTRELLLNRDEASLMADRWYRFTDDHRHDTLPRLRPDEWPPPHDLEPWLDTLLPETERLFDYLPPSTLLVFDEPPQLSAASELVRNGQVVSWDDLLKQSTAFDRLALLGLGVQTSLKEPAHETATTYHFSGSSLQSAGIGISGTAWTATLDRIKQLLPHQRVFILAHSHTQQQRLIELLQDEEIAASRWIPRPFLDEKVSPGLWVAVGELSRGCRLSEADWWLLTEEELFGKQATPRQLKAPRRAKLAAMFSSIEELKLDSYVVHVRHGIGRYQGLQRLTIGGFESDFLVLVYTGGDKIYVPLDRLDLVQKYIGSEGSQPRLDRLGAGTWARTTRRAKRAIEKLAKDLLELYAARSVVPGHPFAMDEPAENAFAASFEYEETPDQLRAIEEVDDNMHAPHPMDRLVCGDVGYGKTEVAMRAAFKTAMNGKQTAILVPTTLLAQQHARTFSQRFAPFPIRVDVLSRFRSAAELKELYRALATGEIDIIIGTHRLLQRKIKFRDLGLLIIDEEQRFGVRQKERLKTLKQSVDCLTLSATPIPRTLQMGMLGLRDLSIIETPPPDRLAIQTRLIPFDREVIRSAIRHELARGGQCFFIHNRIHDLEQIGSFLSELVPEARIVMAHGQMRPSLLEAAMERFVRGQADLLLSTAIVESGLDIPHANTIIIHRADLFGLADLYQLRGRVGRSAVQAFAYLIVPDESTLTSAARARLEAIRDFTELGAGFKIAARDLEIRGAGNLLGPQQSGQIAAIGFELYLQFLDEAVRQIRGESVAKAVEPTLALKLSAYLPETYVADSHQRLAFYKRLASADREAELQQILEQLTDRFGPAPIEAGQLVDVMTLRLYAKQLGIRKVEMGDGRVLFFFSEEHPLSADALARLTARSGTRLHFPDEWTIAVRYSTDEWPSLYQELRADLQALLGCDRT